MGSEFRRAFVTASNLFQSAVGSTASSYVDEMVHFTDDYCAPFVGKFRFIGDKVRRAGFVMLRWLVLLNRVQEYRISPNFFYNCHYEIPDFMEGIDLSKNKNWSMRSLHLGLPT